MGLRESARAAGVRRPGSVCGVRKLLDVSPELHAELLEMMAEVDASGHRVFSSQALADALDASGVDLSEGALSRHRRGACRCEVDGFA